MFFMPVDKNKIKTKDFGTLISEAWVFQHNKKSI